ncbi:hypothetical protein L596_022178 [Steinernema carpocapsae]|uniref:Uncharacterized protein n=1 Tax=Steinernema carpocapsae TaxID=34508 RepID=A0A4V6A064_STECR|nr:hypothetical protein L596_022178 [Steinernema carpocapsae]
MYTVTPHGTWEYPYGAPQVVRKNLFYFLSNKLIEEKAGEVVLDFHPSLKGFQIERVLATSEKLFGVARSSDPNRVVLCRLEADFSKPVRAVEVQPLGHSDAGHEAFDRPTFYNPTGLFWREAAGLQALDLGEAATNGNLIVRNVEIPLEQQDRIEAAFIRGRLLVLNLTKATLHLAENDSLQPPLPLDLSGLPPKTSSAAYTPKTGHPLWLVLFSCAKDAAENELQNPVLLIINAETGDAKRLVLWEREHASRKFPMKECFISTGEVSVWIADEALVTEAKLRLSRRSLPRPDVRNSPISRTYPRKRRARQSPLTPKPSLLKSPRNAEAALAETTPKKARADRDSQKPPKIYRVDQDTQADACRIDVGSDSEETEVEDQIESEQKKAIELQTLLPAEEVGEAETYYLEQGEQAHEDTFENKIQNTEPETTIQNESEIRDEQADQELEELDMRLAQIRSTSEGEATVEMGGRWGQWLSAEVQNHCVIS